MNKKNLDIPDDLKQSIEEITGPWWSSDDNYVYFGIGQECLTKGSMYELFGSLSRSAIRHQIQVLEENKHMNWHSFSEEFELLKNPNFKPLKISI